MCVHTAGSLGCMGPREGSSRGILSQLFVCALRLSLSIHFKLIIFLLRKVICIFCVCFIPVFLFYEDHPLFSHCIVSIPVSPRAFAAGVLPPQNSLPPVLSGAQRLGDDTWPPVAVLP